MEFPLILSLESLKYCCRYFDKTYQQENFQCHSVPLAASSKFKRATDIVVNCILGDLGPGVMANREVDFPIHNGSVSVTFLVNFQMKYMK